MMKRYADIIKNIDDIYNRVTKRIDIEWAAQNKYSKTSDAHISSFENNANEISSSSIIMAEKFLCLKAHFRRIETIIRYLRSLWNI